MTGGWRAGVFVIGAVLGVCGLALWANGAGPFLLIMAAVVLVAGALEPVYGRLVTRPRSANWRTTSEKFVDPETGELVTVWFDPTTGERRYVSEHGKG